MYENLTLLLFIYYDFNNNSTPINIFNFNYSHVGSIESKSLIYTNNTNKARKTNSQNNDKGKKDDITISC